MVTRTDTAGSEIPAVDAGSLDKAVVLAGKEAGMNCVIVLMPDGQQYVIERVKRVECSGHIVTVYVMNQVLPVIIDSPIKFEVV